VITNVQATNAGSYALAITNIAGSITSAPATLTVILPPLITSQPQSRSNVVGTTASYSVLASSLVPIGYQWQLNGSPLGGATDSNLVVTNVQVANAGNYAVVLTNLAGSVTSIIATLTVLIPPAFVSQPQSVTNIPGGSAAFSATATGTAPLAYQWQFNSQNVAGATGSTLALTNVQPADAGNYSLIATNLAGSATSAVATLSVIIPPSISAQPQSRTNVAGSLAAFSVTVSGGLPLAYQWQGNGTNIPGATDSSLNISNVQPADAQAYSVVVTNLAGSVTSSVAVLTVWLPPAITTQPQGRTNLAGTSVTFNTAANGTAPLSYQWQLNSVSLPGASSTSLTISNVQVSDAGNYSVVVTNIAGATTSSVAVLVLATPPVITSQPQSLTNIAGTTAAFSVLVNGTAPLSYGWSFNNAIIVGATNATLTVTNVQPANAGTYLVTITNAYGAVTSAPAALTVIVPPPACTPPASGMVGWWPAEGTAEDIFSTNDGILQGGTTATNAGVLGTAFSFDGVNSYVQINDSPLFHPANLTIEAWVRFTSLDSPAVGRSPPGEQYIVFKQNSRNNSFEGFDLGKYRVGNNDYFRFQVASSSGKEIMILSTTAVSTGVWYHVAGVRGANFLQIYVNGHLDTQTSVDFAQDYDVLPLYFGTSGQSTWDHKFSGLLDEVSLYNRALGSNEIFAIYAAGSSGKCRLPAIESQPRSLLTAVGSNASFSVFAIGAAPLAYQWRFNGVDLPGASGSVLTLTNVQTSSSGNYVVVVSNYLGWVTSSVATLSVLTPPSFTTQPANLTNLLGSTASFSAVAAGSTPLSYRWQQNGVFLTNSARVTGVASNTLSVTSIQAADAGSYAVVASNAVGVATSAPASLIVWVPPAIVNQPQSQTVVAGTNAILTITTSGTPAPAYQWQFNSAILPGATNSTLVLSNVQPAQAGDYFVTVTNAIGSATSAVAAITVLVPASIVTQPGSLVVVVGSAATFTAQAAGTAPLSLQWRFNGTNLTNGGRVLGANANTLVITNIQFADAGSYTMLVTNSVGSAVSSAATLTVATPPVIQSQPATVQVLVGTNAGFSVAVSGSAPFAYQWQRNGTNLIDGGNILGSSTSSLTLANLQTNDSAAFQVVVTNIAGAITSAPANLLVTTTPIPPAIVTQPSPQTIEVGNDAGLAAVVTGTLPLSYQWRKNGVNLPPAGNIFGINGAALTIQNAQTTDTGDYQLVVTNSGGVVTSSVARLAVNLSVKVSADSLVLVNSTSPRYSDFSHFIQPYLDNFGIPYTVADIATNVIGTNVGRYALIIVGHNQLDPSGLYLDSAGHHNIASAIAAGTGLVNFDSAGALAGRSPPYQFAQDIFGISYGSAATGSTVSYPATQPGGQMHYITSLHPTNETLVLSNNLTFSGLTLSNATVLAVSGGMPLVGVAQYGQGRAVQWGGYAWMSTTVHGPLNGLDDLVWRGCVWAARKPFVMRGLPNFVAMRVDDVEGPLRWVHIANEVGFKPFLALFMGNVSPTNIADLRSLITNGNATASIHSFTASTLFYFDHQNLTNYSDSVISNNFYIGAQWHQTNGIPMSRSMIPHYSEIGPNAFPLLSNLGIDFIALEVVPGTVEYGAHPAPWLMAGPYRLSDPPGQGQVNLPLFYADFMNVPGHPELAGRYFDRYTEIRNTAVPGAYECGEWCPDNNDIAGSINRATVQIKRALDSQVLASVFTHEWNIHPTTCCGSTTISDNNWRAILYGVTNNLAAYHPIYVTTDYADQYVRATRTSRLVSCQFDSSSGQLTTTFSGKTDLDLSVQIYQGADNLITNIAGTVPMFTGSSTSVVATLPTAPVIYSPPMASTNNAGATVSFQVGAGGAPPLRYRWFRNGTSALNDAGTIVGSANSTLTIGGVLGSDAGTYSVVVSNANGSVTSAPVVLAVNDPFLFSQPLSRTNHAGTDAAFTVGVNGTQPAYQWFKDGVPAAGATAKTLILPAVTPADAAGYNVLVSNIYGSLLSATASLSVSSPLFIQSLVVTDGSASVTWSAIPGRSYLLQSKETMTDPAWTSTVASLTATGSLATATNLLGNSTQRFYRVFLVP
jgi:hypothetical protein